MMGTDVAVRQGFDLTRAPDEAWNAEMVELVSRQLFRNQEITVAAVRYCLAIADALQLNPLIGEVYFIPAKSKDGKGPAWQPYIGRNGLVARAEERGYHYESDTVHENDRFRMTRRKDGTVEVTHSYTQADRGNIVGAYAFLHDDAGRRKPAFFYAELDHYMPTFSEEWKLRASPWGNQLSAMIEKCAMIGAGRKRLRLGHVLIDGEVPMYEHQNSIGPGSLPPADIGAYPFEELTDDAALAERLRVGAHRGQWSAAKVELVMGGRSHDELVAIAERFEGEPENRAATDAMPAPAGAGGSDTPGGGSEPVPGGSEPQDTSEEVRDAEVVPDEEHIAALEVRKARIEDALNDPTLPEDDHAQALEELDGVECELAAARDPGQSNLFG